MKCPVCDSETSVYATKAFDALKVRYRRCKNCGGKYLSYEELQTGRKLRRYKDPKPRGGQIERRPCPKCGKPLASGRIMSNGGWITSYFCTPCRATFKVQHDESLEEIGVKFAIIEADIGHRVMP